MSWTEERIEKLKVLWSKPLSATQIAAALGGLQHCRDGGRNAVIGKVRRLGLPFRGHKGNGLHRNRVKRKAAPVATSMRASTTLTRASTVSKLVADGLPLPPSAEFDVPRIPTVDLESHHCRFPCVADVREVGAFAPIFCGLETVAGLPYCEVHSRRAFQPPQVRSRQLDLPAESNVVPMPERETVAA